MEAEHASKRDGALRADRDPMLGGEADRGWRLGDEPARSALW